MELYDSKKYKEEVSGLAFDISSQNLQDSYLTNLQNTDNNAIFERNLAEEENKKDAIKEARLAEAQETWKDKLKNKNRKKGNKLVDMISAGGLITICRTE